MLAFCCWAQVSGRSQQAAVGYGQGVRPWVGGACPVVAHLEGVGVDLPFLSSRTTWIWPRPPHPTPCFMMMASQRRRRPWWTVIMLPSLEPSPPRGLKTNSMVEFHMHLLDSSNTVFPALSLLSVMLKSPPGLNESPPALSLLVCEGLVLHQFTFRHFSTMSFLKGCEKKCNCHSALQFKIIILN